MIPNFRVLKKYFTNDFVIDAIENGWGVNRNKYIDLVETFLASFSSRKYAVLFNNATNASQAALSYCKSYSNDFLTLNNTWFGTVSPAVRNNYNVHLLNTSNPFFIDESDIDVIDEYCKNNKLDKLIICNVDLMGFSGNHIAIQEYCDSKGFIYINDAAESMGSKYCGAPTSSFGEFATLSFNATKIVSGTAGGVVVTNNKDLAEYLKDYRNNFQNFKFANKYFNSYDFGTNANLSNIIAGHIYGQLLNFEKILLSRKQLYKLYSQSLYDFLFHPNPNCEPNYWHTCAKIDTSITTKENFINTMKNFGVEIRPGFYKISEQGVFDELNIKLINDYVADPLLDYICLPAGDISIEEVNSVIKAIKEIYCA